MNKTVDIPDWLLERFMLGELPAADMDRVRAAASAPAVALRLRRLEADNAAFLARHPRLTVRPPAAPSGPAGGKRLRRTALRLTPLVAAVIAVVVVTVPDERTEPETIDGIRVKGGGDSLVVFKEAGPGTARELADGSTVDANDRLQIGFRSVSGAHAAIVSVDGRGAVTLHYPDTQDAPTATARGRLQLLAKSYILDDAPRFERFYLFISQQPLDAKRIVDELRRLARDTNLVLGLTTVPGLAPRQISLLLRKAAP